MEELLDSVASGNMLYPISPKKNANNENVNCVFLLRRKFYLSFHHSHHDKDCSQRFTPDVMELIRIMVLTCVMEYRFKSCYGVSWCTDHLHGSQTLSA